MPKLFKQFPVYALETKADAGRVRKGIAAVFGNVDSGGDRIQPGAFAKTIQESTSRIKHLWNHDMWEPPIAKIVDLKEVGRDALPPEVIEKAPEATGGLMVAREYFKSARASEVLEAVDAGAVNEMSFGYKVIKSAEMVEDEEKINDLLELRLFDTSDVNWGMNFATVANGAKSGIHAVPVGLLVQQLTERIKAGLIATDAEKDLLKTLAVGVFENETLFDDDLKNIFAGFRAGTDNDAEPGAPDGKDDPDDEAEAAKALHFLNSQIKLSRLKLNQLR